MPNSSYPKVVVPWLNQAMFRDVRHLGGDDEPCSFYTSPGRSGTKVERSTGVQHLEIITISLLTLRSAHVHFQISSSPPSSNQEIATFAFMPTAYFSLAHPTTGEYKEKGSKFLAFAYPVQSEADVKDRLDALRKQYYDARHHCYAYVLGLDRQQHRANDDGEPNHSAGDPILGQIRSHELTNCQVVVVRYFGGTKLGVPGLVHAYRTAAADALQKVERITLIKTVAGRFTFGYDQLGTVERWVEELALTVHTRDFTETCTISFDIAEESVVELQGRLTEFPLIGFELVQVP